jgi:hypothetical protein
VNKGQARTLVVLFDVCAFLLVVTFGCHALVENTPLKRLVSPW